MGVEVSEEVLVVNVIERVCKGSLSEYGEQRANFPYGVCGLKAPQGFNEDKGSSGGDMRSPNGPFMFYGVPGKARVYLDNVVLPSAWSERVQCGCESYYDERER